MKTIKILFFLLFFAAISSIDASAMQPKDGSRHNHPRPGAVGAPLDGGLLAVLGVAGVAYYSARKKNKKNMEN